MRVLKILLIGQPNVGKSSLFNALVGPRVTVSNYPGTTVEVTRAKKVLNQTLIEFEDTPGVYSISDRSEEEKITEKSLFERKIDGVVVLADCLSLERSLYLILQILEAQIPTILALNFVESAEKRGIKINSKKLERLLRVPVIPINPLTGKGVDELQESLLNIKKAEKPFRVRYDNDIEKAISKVSFQFGEISLPKRFVSLRILEGDQDFYKYLRDKEIIREAEEDLVNHSKVAEDISITRYGTGSFIAARVTRIIPLWNKERWEEKIDKILLHKIWGQVATGLFLFLTFGVLLYLGNWTQSLLMGWTERLLSAFSGDNSLFSMILIQALSGLAAGISIALPYVLLFYLLLGLLEDIGLLSRFIVNAERFLGKLGLPGKSFIPLVLGLGCVAPATRATRVLTSRKEQFFAASMFAFLPCSSRIAIIMGIVGFYGGVKLAFFVFATSFIAGLLWALGAKYIFQIKKEPLLLELPPYRKPLFKNVLIKSWLRMKDFIYIVIPLLAAGGIAYGILKMAGLTEIIIGPFAPITAWLGLPSAVIIPLVFGFLQKDLTGAMLISTLGSGVSSVLSPSQIYIFGVASTIGIPCIIAFGMLLKEFGLKKSLALTAGSITYGLLIAGLINKIIFIFK